MSLAPGILLPAWLYCCLMRALRKPGRAALDAAMSAAVLMGCVVVGLTEGLGHFHALTRECTIVGWSIMGAIGAASLQIQRPPIGRPIVPPLAWIALSLLAGSTALAALWAPPNTIDSLTYHMARVACWMENRSVAAFPTADLRQIYSCPMAEYAVLQLQLLVDSDRLANAVQWVAAMGCAAGAAGLTRILKGQRTTQLFAALLCLSIPMLDLQASSTQNDAVEAFWLVCLAYLGLAVKGGWGDAALLGAALGLAVLTKGSAYFLAAPIVLTLALLCWRLWKHFLLKALLALAVMGLLNLGYWQRNLALCGDPLALYAVEHIRTESMTPKLLALNLVRDASSNFDAPGLHDFVERAIHRLHRMAGVDVDDRRITFRSTHFHVVGWRRQEDCVGDGPQLSLVGMAMLMLVLRRRPCRSVQIYALVWLAQVILFAWTLRWQPWIVRLELPILVLSCPLSALFLESLASKKLAGAIVAAQVCIGLGVVLCNDNRPLLFDHVAAKSYPRWNVFSRPREEQYFSNCHFMYATYRDGLAQLVARHPDWVGLLNFRNESIVWAWLKDHDPAVQLTHVDVANETRFSPGPPPGDAHSGPPQLIFGATPLDVITVEGRLYSKVWEQDHLKLFALVKPPEK